MANTRLECVARAESRVAVLDGWRAISILSVLACHMLPLGPKSWRLNETAGPLGMVLFFNLSGFLITSTLLEKPDVRSFFIRRACRILPLALLFILLSLAVQQASAGIFLTHLCFYVNYQPDLLTTLTSPLWSLCVEVQFYGFVGLLVMLLGRRGLVLLVPLCVAVTATRAFQHTHISLATHLRVDEILAGAALALAHHSSRASSLRAAVGRLPLVATIAALLICCHPSAGPMNYIRPYAGAIVVANTLWRRDWMAGLLESRPMKYVADISYALYVIHPIMRFGWLGAGGAWEKYLLKRPIGFALTFLLAHFSTFYFEKRWIAWGKVMAGRRAVDARSVRSVEVAVQ